MIELPTYRRINREEEEEEEEDFHDEGNTNISSVEERDLSNNDNVHGSSENNNNTIISSSSSSSPSRTMMRSMLRIPSLPTTTTSSDKLLLNFFLLIFLISLAFAFPGGLRIPFVPWSSSSSSSLSSPSKRSSTKKTPFRKNMNSDKYHELFINKCSPDIKEFSSSDEDDDNGNNITLTKFYNMKKKYATKVFLSKDASVMIIADNYDNYNSHNYRHSGRIETYFWDCTKKKYMQVGHLSQRKGWFVSLSDDGDVMVLQSDYSIHAYRWKYDRWYEEFSDHVRNSEEYPQFSMNSDGSIIVQLSMLGVGIESVFIYYWNDQQEEYSTNRYEAKIVDSSGVDNNVIYNLANYGKMGIDVSYETNNNEHNNDNNNNVEEDVIITIYGPEFGVARASLETNQLTTTTTVDYPILTFEHTLELLDSLGKVRVIGKSMLYISSRYEQDDDKKLGTGMKMLEYQDEGGEGDWVEKYKNIKIVIPMRVSITFVDQTIAVIAYVYGNDPTGHYYYLKLVEYDTSRGEWYTVSDIPTEDEVTSVQLSPNGGSFLSVVTRPDINLDEVVIDIYFVNDTP